MHQKNRKVQTVKVEKTSGRNEVVLNLRGNILEEITIQIYDDTAFLVKFDIFCVCVCDNERCCSSEVNTQLLFECPRFALKKKKKK